MNTKKLLIIGFFIVFFSIIFFKNNKPVQDENIIYNIDSQTGILKYNNFNNPEQINDKQQISIINGNMQEITTNIYEYPSLIVQKNIPIRWTIVADEQNLNSCNNEIVIPKLNISKKLELGENIFEFTLEDRGLLSYSCWMGINNATIIVVDDINIIEDIQIDKLQTVDSCCESLK